jgi:hypothetical protein
MSFKLFDVEFDSDEPIEVGSKKMDKVCQIVGTKFIKEWIEYWIEKGKMERGDIEGYYKCLKVLEECDFRNLRED